MRGDAYPHNAVVAQLAGVLASHRIAVGVEHYLGAGIGWGDLWFEVESARVLVEVELGPRRVPRDCVKAMRSGATHLLVVVPSASVVRGSRAALSSWLAAGIPGGTLPFDVHFLTFPAALLALSEDIHAFLSRRNHPGNQANAGNQCD